MKSVMLAKERPRFPIRLNEHRHDVRTPVPLVWGITALNADGAMEKP